MFAVTSFLTLPADRAGRAASGSGLLACLGAALSGGRPGYGAWAYFCVTTFRALSNRVRMGRPVA
ncbi:hypothetical protein ATY41_00110 [Leifsonia xyli subsp. xyli]|uniref:Uncharacterized protein n=1 Tax=Leifsonia xyli subsp. xyli TaxID=59736 RepID=A0A1E2SNA9_LEIXY|nr:hypothetical protein ATY41_00110 [Leifsonia xyli subsp. xyli]